MNIDFESLMSGKSDEGLMDYIVRADLYTEEAIRAAVAEFKKRGKVFTQQEEFDLEAKFKQKRENNAKGGVVEDDPFRNFSIRSISSISSTVILSLITLSGGFFAIVALFTTHGCGGGCEIDAFFRIITFTSSVLFAASVFVIVRNATRRKFHAAPLIFLLVSTPVMYGIASRYYSSGRLNRKPDLRAQYKIPVSTNQYLLDSTLAANYVVAETKDRNAATGGADIISTTIDTLIYSEKGDMIFVIYGELFEKNDLGNDLEAAYLLAHERDSAGWIFYQPVENYSVHCHTMDQLKAITRKLYFNQFQFSDKYKGTEEYFWDRMKRNPENENFTQFID